MHIQLDERSQSISLHWSMQQMKNSFRLSMQRIYLDICIKLDKYSRSKWFDLLLNRLITCLREPPVLISLLFVFPYAYKPTKYK